MMGEKQALGKEGETIAAAYLAAQGYQLSARNYRAGRGEIDLVAKHEDTLVFIEVKTRSSNSYGHPEEAITEHKQSMLADTADHYLAQHPWTGAIRFDVVAIELSESPTIAHFEDAFAPRGNT